MDAFNISSLRVDRFHIDSSMFSSEDQILNSLWIGLMGIETLMVVGVVCQSLAKRFTSKTSPQPVGLDM
ncbi:hypothetical protein CFIMG_007835RA00001 [Ceratocystis fimbriata CBS 114723]|uniref:Uncharacterized protein n=2 Tax=Ceratocystis TaxID=5157 RepID=A0A0F8AXC7_CERFI|nr:hypothetical protein CFO_g4901 [Ceratocystis platani]PHH49306.1 hypothetical protein CFIMG_007835RA00001 [Ceratocystis fimbriata CBS 114723]